MGQPAGKESASGSGVYPVLQRLEYYAGYKLLELLSNIGSGQAESLMRTDAERRTMLSCWSGRGGRTIAQLQAELANVNQEIAMNEMQRRICEMISQHHEERSS